MYEPVAELVHGSVVSGTYWPSTRLGFTTLSCTWLYSLGVSQLAKRFLEGIWWFRLKTTQFRMMMIFKLAVLPPFKGITLHQDSQISLNHSAFKVSAQPNMYPHGTFCFVLPQQNSASWCSITVASCHFLHLANRLSNTYWTLTYAFSLTVSLIGIFSNDGYLW